MAFAPRFIDGKVFGQDIGKVVCVGRNYAAHARELGNDVPDQPLLFIKPASSVVDLAKPIAPPRHLGTVHFETELSLLIGRRLHEASPDAAREAIVGMGLALDLTLRDMQDELKARGQPWERAKGFNGACPLSPFVSVKGRFVDWQQLGFSMDINGELRQRGYTERMLFPVAELVSEISHCFTLEPGDVVLTGTPEGVGVLPQQARLTMAIDDWLFLDTATV
ncbi:fumarylacetoacetate hydrolase family protein [Larsenimonas rhizosphaerae]|uniref:Fumarylacetoacetate hydrolase family protein n=1 Tax=Larsenimonas rhizosphaerae TaxID=2944682 RepID=A0AA42CXS7_9GAMM|nr:fumarylacetoacetate hydrolase family protein [Larsenimonas rhizosphaerae]MCM2129567.1 fumarylacetoacetate hydrolase family protein [Larsenimonas rhizosphaerae]MCX2524225.1 fumarylacetoacetate hydrolase family protein [Larsenimonas rhizosphaerae]